MRYTEIKLLIFPFLLFLIFFGADSPRTRWYTLLNQQEHHALETLIWASGAWLSMRLIRAFVWQRRPKQLSGAAPPMLLQHIVNLLILAFAAACIAQSVFDQPLTGFWATSGVVGIVLGIALRGIIADFFSGIALELDPPFKIGDFIEVRMGGEPVIGRVTEVNWRATQIVPRDSTNTVYVPNSLMGSIAVNNLYHPFGRTRFELLLWFDPGISHDRVVRVLMSAAMSTDCIVQDPPPDVVAARYNASGVEYVVRYWLTPEVSPTGARNRLMAAITDFARRGDLQVAFPRREIVFEPKPEAVRDPLEVKIRFLERNRFFRSWQPEELKAIATHLHTRKCPPGTRILTFGEPGNSMFVVAEGLLEVSLPSGPERQSLVVAKLVGGDFFGEMAMLTGDPRSASVTSVTETVLYEIRRQHIQDLVQRRPEIAEAMSHVAAERRLQNQNAELALDSETPSEEHLNLRMLILQKIHSLFG